MSLQQQISNTIDKKLAEYQDLALDIHAHPEVSNYEFYSCEVLSNQLKKEGFEVVVDVAGHRTGFSGVYDTHKPGPTVAYLVEYDALAGLGHGCGHNLFGTNSILSAVGLKSVVDQIGGKIVVYGTPGEEGGENGSAKGSFVKAGLFDQVDFALCAHPGSYHSPSSPLLANDPMVVEFYGKPAHAASSPEEGINALDAMIQVFNGLNAMRQQVSSDVRMHGIITKGGDAPNIIPEFTQAKFYLRALTRKTLNIVTNKFVMIVEGAALQTGCQYKVELFQNSVDDMVLTPSLDALYVEQIEKLGEKVVYLDHKKLGSSDVGNVSYVVPTIQPHFQISPTPVVGHTEDFKQASCSTFGLESIRNCSKALAYTALTLFQDPQLLEQIKQEHAQALAKKKA